MRLMIVGSLQSHMTQAGKIAIKRGAKVQHAEDTEQALGALRAGHGADVVMVDVKQNIAEFISQLEKERFVMLAQRQTTGQTTGSEYQDKR
jgi:hypothetical protein